jgi:hypothetical protein
MRAVLVVGMHRSGTSCLAGSLQQRGLYLGEAQEWNRNNRKGNREDLRVVRLNSAVLAHSGGAWDRPPAALAWTPRHARERDEIVSLLCAGASTESWGFKDPRTLLTLPFWLEGIADPVTLVGSFRHPAQVARSLHARGQVPFGEGVALWRRYNELLLEEYRRRPFPLVCFDLPERDYLSQLDRLASSIGLPATGGMGGTGFFERSLRHWQVDDGGLPEVPAECAALYQRLLDAGREMPDGDTRREGAPA